MNRRTGRWVLSLAAAAACLTGTLVPAQSVATENAYPKGDPAVIRMAHSNLCIGVSQGSKSNGAQVGQWTCNGARSQVWYVLRLSVFVITMQNANSGKCMDVQRGSAANGARIVQYTCTASNNQRMLRHPDGWVATTVSDNQKCLDIARASRVRGAPMVQFTCNDRPNQHLIFNPR